ncbi:hypothetical protein LWC34_48605 [Kibdelosporangium philippinense]|uniref:Uncharacterized protein n=1 Tax=Kibdelosporangium philippinense TaxID=211113 RepID=A0ABS8ZUF8_9PSEU|nr:hypothetical protein [Kibdelosporangium philippinense]
MRVLERGPVDVIEPVEVDLGILDVIGSECQERVRRLRDHHDLRQIGPPPWIDQHDRPILIDGTQLAYVELGSAAEEPAMLPSERVGLPANRSVGAPPGIVDRIRSLVDHSDRPTRPLDSVEIKGIRPRWPGSHSGISEPRKGTCQRTGRFFIWHNEMGHSSHRRPPCHRVLPFMTRPRRPRSR